MRFGLPDLIFFAMVLAAAAAVGAIAYLWTSFNRRARRFAYPSTAAYLHAAPRSDAEKRDAADLALKGLVWCLLGVLFAPLVLVGLLPLFYGGRKVVYASMGLDLIDDADQSGA